ncbi:Glycosyltransferase involved in cell wall bisynthesis [Dyadobacter koreensis]|uniref:Glycosyltransferase involved in cell wall bisynthesis n=1 Tax=Dyadobacter koreensis TaxID=408657 RepID=A0A1H6QJ11_9BACT|nr:glycosyltransferase [Dyadobacter koreensis]SEI40167.1 Glycosyltransferase involved in cell wall bisynthesis [Dyadobacter koreensis]
MSLVSVLMPIYNQENYIRESLESLLSQTMTDLEIVVINDGSTDSSLDIINSYGDKRIKVYSNEGNKGLIYSLNRGIELCQDSKYIARLDGDDIALPDRLQKQVNILNANSEVGLLGGSSIVFGDNVKTRISSRPIENRDIITSFIAMNSFSHPTMLIRTEILLKSGKRYSTDFPKYEDYGLWIDLIGTCEFKNISDVLIRYRRHANNITKSYKEDISKNFHVFNRLLALYIDKIECDLTQDEKYIISVITSKSRARYDENVSIDHIRSVINSYCLKIKKTNMNASLAKELLLGKAIMYLRETNRNVDMIKLIGNPSYYGIIANAIRHIYQWR